MTKETAKKEKTESTKKPKEAPSAAKASTQKDESTPKPKSSAKESIKRPRCTTCGLSVESEKIWVDFKCPSCGKVKIIRCERCKRLENPYVCEGCGFRGP